MGAAFQRSGLSEFASESTDYVRAGGEPMRRLLILSASAATLVAAVTFGAFPIVLPSRLHLQCDAPSNETGPVRLAHLRNEVEAAEEIGVRHGDSRRKSEGREGEHQRQRECTDKLLANISTRHGVTISDLTALRGQRPLVVDALVLASTMAGLVIVVWRLTPVVAEKFADVPAWLLAVSTLLSVVCGIIATATLTLLAHAVEIARLWDGHMSYRNGRLPWEQHPFLTFAGIFVLFWTVAVSRLLTVRLDASASS